MNDNELITLVKESVTDVHMTVPEEQIMSRGRALRARRRIPVLGVALAGAAGAVLAATALVSASHQPDIRLAAWTVAKQANGDIDLTINQLRNPAGLQTALRADGLPVNVTFSGYSASASCHVYPTSLDVLHAVITGNITGKGTLETSAPVVINPSALPSGAGLAIFVVANPHNPYVGPAIPPSVSAPPLASLGTGTVVAEGMFGGNPSAHNPAFGLLISPVDTSQQCTG
jgi:hypothetical protein